MTLTDGQIADIAERMEATDPTCLFWRDFARAIERALDSSHLIAPVEQTVPGEWIPTSERLPEVEACTEYANDDRAGCNSVLVYYKDEAMRDSGGSRYQTCATAYLHGPYFRGEITHWMPLPPAPGSQADTDRLTPNEKESPASPAAAPTVEAKP